MNADEIRDLAALYAMGGLDGEDRVRFETLLAEGDAAATAALREFEGTLVDFAAADTATPPARVKQALMERIAAETGDRPAPAVVRPMPARRSWWPAVWAGAMAAGIAAIVVGLAISASYQKRLDALAQETRALQAEIDRQRAVVDLVRDPAAQMVTLAGQAAAPEARARMIWQPTQGGLLVAAGLPPAPAGKAYQLWAIAGQNAPVSAGVFEVDPKGSASLRVPKLAGVDKVDVFAVTLEPAGGLPAPSGPMVLAGKT